MNQRIPAEVFPPGSFIKDELDARGWTQTDLAEILGRPLKTVSDILLGKRAITPETAKGLGEAFGTDPQFWLELEGAYRLYLLRQEGGEIARKARLYAMAPIKEMTKRQWITSHENVNSLEEELCRFFEIASLDAEPEIQIAARKSTSYSQTTPEQRAWFYRAKHLAESISVSPFREERFDELFAKLHLLTVHEQEARKVPRVLAEFGIRFVVVEHLSRTKIDGAALWLDPVSPVVALSIRFDRIDAFWHTLGHELGHIMNRDGSKLDDDLVSSDSDQDRVEKPESERKADEIASSLLIPNDEIESFIARVRPYYSRQRINQFANRIKVHPGIIVGQLQHRKEIKFSQGREMLVKVRERVIQSALTDGWGYYSPI